MEDVKRKSSFVPKDDEPYESSPTEGMENSSKRIEKDVLAADTKKRSKSSQASQEEEDDFDMFDQERNRTHPLLQKIIDFRERCGETVNNPRVQFMIVVFISINAIMMGIGTYNFVRENKRLDDIFETVDLVFLIIFTFELFLQFIYLGWRLILDGWLVFDLVVIITSWSFSSVQIIRAFRIFRALRLVTRIKIMKNLILGEFEKC